MKCWRIIVACASLITLPVLIESCCGVGGGACPCNPDWATSFTVTNLSLSTETRGSLYDTLSPSPAPLKKYRFVIDVEGKYNRALLEDPFELRRPTMAAFACSPEVPQSEQTISEFVITSTNDFSTTDETIGAGQDLAVFFMIDLIDYPLSSIEDILGKHFYDERLYLISEKSVDKEQTHKLTVRIKLDDGQIYELTTKDVVFTVQ
jgi:hypothetical protein